VQLRAEEVDPEIPVHWDPQESLAHADECGRLRDGVRREVVQLHAVVEAQPAQEATRRRREATLVEADEDDDVAERRVGLPVPRRRVNPRRGPPILVRRQLAGGHQLAPGQPHRRRARPRQRVDHGDGLRGGGGACGSAKECGETRRALGVGEGARALLWVGSERDEDGGRYVLR
jgi:hypothetical protein